MRTVYLVKQAAPESIPITRRPLGDVNAALTKLQQGRVVLVP